MHKLRTDVAQVFANTIGTDADLSANVPKLHIEQQQSDAFRVTSRFLLSQRRKPN
jgi:hypothetical protein